MSSSSQTESAGPSKGTSDALLTVDESPPAETSNGTELPPSAHSSFRSVGAGIYRPNSKEEWLSSPYLSADVPGIMTVNEFSKVRASTHEADAYWQNPHIDWALETIRRRHEGLNDVHITPTFISAMLYRIGIDPEHVLAREQPDWMGSFGSIAEDLASCNVVILPINNGFEENTKERTKQEHNERGVIGGHWSFIVVDRRDSENPSAYYVDGMVKAERRQNGKWRVNGIHFNGRIAGKVLCGFENLLGLEKGRFAANTMKFVPHMYDDNAPHLRDNDEGSCGPHLYAFMDHILTNRTTLMDPGMDSIYNDAATKELRASEFGFDSVASRARFAEELMQERRRQEAAQPANYVDNLTPDVLRSLMTVDKLISLVRSTAASVRSVASGHKGAKKGTGTKSDDERNDDDDDEDGTFGDGPVLPKSFLREVIQSNPGRYQDLSKRADRYRRAYDFLKGQQQAHDSENGSKATGKKAQNPKKKDAATTADVYVGRVHYRNVPCDDQAIFPPHERPAKFPGSFRHMPFHDMTKYGVTLWINANPEIKAQIKIRDEKNVWIRTACSMLHLKFKKTFLSQPDDEFEQAWSRDEQVFSPEELKVLKEKHKGEENKRILYGIMRERVMRHYQGDENVDALLKRLEKYKVKEPSSGTKRKRSDSDGSGGNDDSESDDAGKKGGTGKRVRSDKDKSTESDGSADEGDMFHQGYRNPPEVGGKEGDSTRPDSTGESSKERGRDDAGAGASKVPVINAVDPELTAEHDSTGNGSTFDAGGHASTESDLTAVTSSSSSTSLTTPRPYGLLNFRTMNPTELDAYMTNEMRNDSRYRDVLLRGQLVEPNDVSMRAMCFVDIAEERFRGESDADCLTIWYNDPLVFTEVQRRTGKCTPGFIRKQMGQHYHPEDLIEEDERAEEQDDDETEEDTDNDEDKDEHHNDGKEFDNLGGEEEGTNVVDDILPLNPSDNRPASKTSSPPQTSNTNGAKRKRENSELPAPKKAKLFRPDFLHMNDEEIARWIGRMPSLFRKEFPAKGQTLEPAQTRRARIWLERMYGEGFEHMRNELPASELMSEEGEELSETEIKIKKHALLSEADRKKLRLWRVNLWSLYPNSPVGNQGFLHNVLLRDPIIEGKKVPIPVLKAERLD